MTIHIAFTRDHYRLQRQVLALTGKVRIFGPDGGLAFYAEQKMFRLKEDIRVYSDESKTTELLTLRARQMLDFAATYDVHDPTAGVKVGAFRRKGFQSLARDTWEILDAEDRPVGVVREDRPALALLRRLLLGSLLPQRYDVILEGEKVGAYQQRFHPLRYELDLEFDEDYLRRFDRRLAIAGAVLLAILEGKQSN